jgi:hypothetical protein
MFQAGDASRSGARTKDRASALYRPALRTWNTRRAPTRATPGPARRRLRAARSRRRVEGGLLAADHDRASGAAAVFDLGGAQVEPRASRCLAYVGEEREPPLGARWKGGERGSRVEGQRHGRGAYRRSDETSSGKKPKGTATDWPSCTLPRQPSTLPSPFCEEDARLPHPGNRVATTDLSRRSASLCANVGRVGSEARARQGAEGATPDPPKSRRLRRGIHRSSPRP